MTMRVLRMVEEQFHRDTEGRPIREGRTPAELLREGEIEYKACPYPGSRFQHANPMNVSALRQTSHHWEEVIDALAFLRIAYTEVRGEYHCELMDVWRVGQLGSSLPWFYILRLGETCPAYAAALSKAALGIGIWGQRVFVDALAAKQLPPRVTPQMMLDTAESTGTLIAEHEVCSAGDKMMLRFFEVLAAETVTYDGAGEVARLAAQRDEVLRFGAHYVAFKQWIWTYWLARRFLYSDVASVLGRQPRLAELLDPTAEPPDFFLVQPEQMVDMPLALRAHWFRGLANFVEPFAPDRSDTALRELTEQIAAVMGREPERLDELTAEIEQMIGRSRPESVRLALAVGTYAALDALFADVIAAVEVGFRGEPAPVITADIRDRMLPLPSRWLFSSLAPETFAQIARP